MGNYSIDYQEFLPDFKDPIEHNGTACFSSMRNNSVKIIYTANIDKGLDQKKVDFYLKFLKAFLISDCFEFNKVDDKFNKVDDKIKFILNSKNMTRDKVLLYLTAFRYVDEYPEIVTALFNSKKKTPTDLFKEFQYIHFKFVNNNERNMKNGNLGGHGLIYKYGWQKFKPISLNLFQKRLKKDDREDVHDFFEVDDIKMKLKKKAFDWPAPQPVYPNFKIKDFNVKNLAANLG